MRKKTKDYDNVFKTMKLKHSRLFIPVINEMFGKNYPMDALVDVLPSEGSLEEGETKDGSARLAGRYSDFLIRICGERYLLEFQAYEDEFIAIRIAEYAFIAAREQAGWSFARAHMRFPSSGVIYLRRCRRIPAQTRISLAFPEGELEYVVHNLKIADYSKESIIGKKLYPLIPFYIARYERRLERFAGFAAAEGERAGDGGCSGTESKAEKCEESWAKDKAGYRTGKETKDSADVLAQVVDDLEYFRGKLEEAYDHGELRAYELLDLAKFVNTIITHITNGNESEERLVKIMGGIVLETESERLLRVGREEGLKQGRKQGIEQGIEQGIKQGIEEGIEQGIKQGIEEGRHEGILNVLISLVRDKLLDCAEAARRAGMTEEQFKKQVFFRDTQYK